MLIIKIIFKFILTIFFLLFGITGLLYDDIRFRRNESFFNNSILELVYFALEA